MKTMENFLWSN